MRELGHGAETNPATAVGAAALEVFLDETRDMPVGPLFALLSRQIAALGVEPVVGSLGVEFRHGESTLCELSLYGELFIVRVGRHLAVEYRVRDEDVAFQALDHVLRVYVERCAEATSAGPS